MNERYKKDAKIGSTRKSAAAARPKRSGASGTSSSSTKKSGTSRGSRYEPVVLPPEIKRLQKISFALLGVAVVISVLYLWQSKALGGAGTIMLGVAYGCMFTALYIDFGKVRPAIKAAKSGKAPVGKSSTKATSAAKSAERESKPARADKQRKKSSEQTETPPSEPPGDERT